MRTMVKINWAFAAAALVLLLAGGCAEWFGTSDSDDLHGKWKPVSISGQSEDATYFVVYDGALDETGRIMATYIGKENPTVRHEGEMLVPALRLFRKGGDNLYTRFFLSSKDGGESPVPLKYKLEGSKIFFELSRSYLVNHPLDEGSGVFDAGKEFVIVDHDHIRIGDVSYVRM